MTQLWDQNWSDVHKVNSRKGFRINMLQPITRVRYKNEIWTVIFFQLCQFTSKFTLQAIWNCDIGTALKEVSFPGSQSEPRKGLDALLPCAFTLCCKALRTEIYSKYTPSIYYSPWSMGGDQYLFTDWWRHVRLVESKLINQMLEVHGCIAQSQIVRGRGRDSCH